MAFEPTSRFLEDEELEKDLCAPRTCRWQEVRGHHHQLKSKRRQPPVTVFGKPITTGGRLDPKASQAWVYVATTAEGGVKIGMTSDLDRRSFELGARMTFSVPVVPNAAKAVETEALRRLGRVTWDSEWVPEVAENAVIAVKSAIEDVRRFRHVDPHLTFEEARKMRIFLALGKRIA